MSTIKSLIINDSAKQYRFKGSDQSLIMGLLKLNIFIGSNNSGKSKFLRSILMDKNLRFNKDTEDTIYYNEFVDEINKEVRNVFNTARGIVSVGSIQEKRNVINEIDYRVQNDEIGIKIEDGLNEINKLEYDNHTPILGNVDLSSDDIKRIKKRLLSVHKKYSQRYDNENLKEKFKSINFKKRIYVPVLRGLRRLNESEDLFEKRTNKDYFENIDENNIEVFTGQSLYKDVLKLLCGNLSERNKLSDFEKFLGDNFFEGVDVALIPKIDSDVLYVKIGQEQEQPIYDLGDGIQSIIILTFKLFENKGDDVLFFIEEPELYLHPGLQRKVIEAYLNEEFDTYQYFITSHSNHLLDLTLDMEDISVYKFNKEINKEDNNNEKIPNFLIENVNNDDMSVLKVLGVNNSSVFLSNCTIWVEGITDRFYIRKYLEIYQKEMIKEEKIKRIYSEDIHYSFLEYSGGNITHWDFLDDTQGDLAPMSYDSICNKIFLIADSDGYNDGKTGKKKERLEKLEKYFENRFYCLSVKEIENILTPEILKKVVAKLKYKKTKDGSEDRDGEIFSKGNFIIDDYKDENIGKFIEDKIDKEISDNKENPGMDGYIRKKKYAKDNTVARKVQFCKYAIEEIKTIDDISQEAMTLCEKIYNFIDENNK